MLSPQLTAAILLYMPTISIYYLLSRTRKQPNLSKDAQDQIAKAIAARVDAIRYESIYERIYER